MGSCPPVAGHYKLLVAVNGCYLCSSRSLPPSHFGYKSLWVACQSIQYGPLLGGSLGQWWVVYHQVVVRSSTYGCFYSLRSLFVVLHAQIHDISRHAVVCFTGVVLRSLCLRVDASCRSMPCCGVVVRRAFSARLQSSPHSQLCHCDGRLSCFHTACGVSRRLPLLPICRFSSQVLAAACVQKCPACLLLLRFVCAGIPHP